MRNSGSVPMVTRNCEVCGSSSGYMFSFRPEEMSVDLDVFACRNRRCGLLFVATEMDRETLSEVSVEPDPEGYYLRIATCNAAKVRRAVRNVAALLPPEGGSLLDVGCGDGQFLKAIAQEYPRARVTGHEVPAAAHLAEARGLQVLTCDLREVTDKFSAIVMLDVAEHLAHPVEAFAACHALLEDRGYLYIHTPRRCLWDSLALLMAGLPLLRQVGVTWLKTRVSDVHLQLWTDQALRLALHRAGFQVCYLEAEMELSWPLERYTAVYLGEALRLPQPVIRLVTAMASVVLVRMRTLRNKAICLARK